MRLNGRRTRRKIEKLSKKKVKGASERIMGEIEKRLDEGGGGE